MRDRGIHRDKAPANPLAVFGTWLEEAGSCGVPAVETFATGLQQDRAAVEAALTMPWSSGQAEGQINKLKLIKRQMYGSANFDLLRRRVLRRLNPRKDAMIRFLPKHFIHSGGNHLIINGIF